MNNNCPFCLELENRYENPLGKDRIIAETDNFIVFPTLGGFVDNYQLIVTKKHLNCFGQLTKESLFQLKCLIKWQSYINKTYFNSETSMFEHGTLVNNDLSGKSIVHAHLHIFSNNKSLIKRIKEYGFYIKKINDIDDLFAISRNKDNYLYYRDIDGVNYVIIHGGIPSQFLRKVLAEELNIMKWNWREYPFLEQIDKSLEFYQNHPEIQYEKYMKKSKI